MTEELRRLYDGVPHDVGVALCEAYQLGLNAGLANKLQEGTFEWAMQQMRQGKAVARRGSAVLFRMANDGLQSFIRGAGKPDWWQDDLNVAVMDILADNWEIVPEPKPEPEGHDFAWAAEQVMCGRWARRKTWEAGWYLGGEKTTVSVHDTRKTDWVLAPQGGSK